MATKSVQSITVADFYQRHRKELELTLLGEKSGFDKPIGEPAPNRPGLALAGFFTYFAKKRVQVLGNSELSYLKKLDDKTREKRFEAFCQQSPPCLVLARGHPFPPELVEVAQKYQISLFTSPLVTMKFLNLATRCLEADFAATTTMHGVMVDYRGIGILLTGKSGAGKSETAIGLLEKGAALVADDMVHIQSIGGELIASSPELSRGYIEMRGIGIINVANLYGLSAIRPQKRLDIIITLKSQADLNEVDRLGIKRKRREIFGIKIPTVEIPVAPGRDTARLVSVAALDLQLRKLGYDMADEFNQRLLAKMNPDLKQGR
ncbi:HPr(Ser) kinase/phosphatase [Roseibacillus ishigakijimensis]|uniref:HPr kinase/phosphorylase n=1 Tax=Roseibacillus ishigakijimensis TaxID=454146 RepID=A0A934VKW7_9BACT|nr:HPr(Ser) kinase/phosphatase [Roseibacillus ishigakijimensis]MBK1834079.1 HPr(Ser) kinase/phosphatase [Roseibacillus ishigakijimensis]